MYEGIGEMESFFEEEAAGLGFAVFFLVLVDELVVDVLFFFYQVQDIRYIFFEEFVFGIGLGLDLAAESSLDELSDFLVVQMQVLGELFEQLNLLLLLLLLHQV